MRVHQAVVSARAVLFDFDFTLADSSDGVVVCMNHALGRLGHPSGPRGRHPQDHRARPSHGARDSGGRGVEVAGGRVLRSLRQEGGRGDGRQHDVSAGARQWYYGRCMVAAIG